MRDSMQHFNRSGVLQRAECAYSVKKRTNTVSKPVNSDWEAVIIELIIS